MPTGLAWPPPRWGFSAGWSFWGVVKRPYKVRVRAQDRNGNFFEAEGEEIVARCFCHEIEHLDGHLFTEHTDRLYTTEELDRMMEEQGE